MSGYPVQTGKVQRPPLRDATLARDRLLEWLRVKLHHRVVLIVAEAGYGKTTLLADFSRRTRHRTLWYRLDEEDRNWIAFLSYLVAAGREVDPGFAPTTARLLDEVGTGSPQLDTVLEAFIRELQPLGEAGATLILDDYHVVDEVPEIRLVMKQLLSRAPERITFMIAARRHPQLPVAKLRALGEVAELTTDDLRFSDAETEELFRDTYGRPLEPDVLTDLSRRTEGWAASLQLVQAAIRTRSSGEVRSFVRALSGAEGDLYDYLAEEVFGDLDPQIQTFLMETSYVDSVDAGRAAAAAGIPPDDAKDRLREAERLGLISKRSPSGRTLYRFHPLVREFLRRRFERDVPPGEVEDLHVRVARHAEAVGDWALAAHHFAEVGSVEDLTRVLVDAVPEIIGTGEYGQASKYLERFESLPVQPEFEVLRSRTEFASGDHESALRRARQAATTWPSHESALANLVALELMAGEVSRAQEVAAALGAGRSTLATLARATLSLINDSVGGHLPTTASRLRALAEEQEGSGLERYRGITLLNYGNTLRAVGDAMGALEAADRAGPLLERAGGPAEQIACRALRGWALAYLGRWGEAASELSLPGGSIPAVVRAEFLVEAAETHAEYGDLAIAEEFLDQAESSATTVPALHEQWRVVRLEVLLRRGDRSESAKVAGDLALGVPVPIPGHHAHQLSLLARLALLQADANLAAHWIREGIRIAGSQGSIFRASQMSLLQAAGADRTTWDRAVRRTAAETPAVVTSLAELVSSRLHDLDPTTLAGLRTELDVHPLPWRRVLRLALDGEPATRVRAAELLEQVGDADDVPRLRAMSRALRLPGLGRGLARRLARRVWIEDQGRVSVVVGDEVIPGTAIRRKVLAALCFLIAKPRFSATRDEILEALWPNLPPDVAMNSLNQAVYFLRRVFEPEYQEAISPGYVHHDSEVIWLDPDLCSSRSVSCWRLIESMPNHPSPEDVERLAGMYVGRFALDFAYEDWAAAYRDSLHAAYLQIIENSVSADTENGDYARGIRLARRALEIDPTAEQLELSLLRLYQLTGAHAAAAEQYSHYSSMLRNELGLEPPPLNELVRTADGPVG